MDWTHLVVAVVAFALGVGAHRFVWPSSVPPTSPTTEPGSVPPSRRAKAHVQIAGLYAKDRFIAARIVREVAYPVEIVLPIGTFIRTEEVDARGRRIYRQVKGKARG